VVDVTPIKKLTPTATAGGGSVFGNAMNLVMNNIWFVVLFLSIGAGIILFIYIWKKSEKKFDPFLEDWKLTEKLCKQFKKLKLDKVMRFHSETGLETLGEYEGECITKDKSINIMYSTFKWGFIGRIIRIVLFPLRPLLKLIMKEYHIVKTDYDKHLVTWDNQNVIIRALALSSSSYFLSPVLADKKGKIIDDRSEEFQKSKETALNTTLYNLTTDFANIMRERINMETAVRYEMKKAGTEVTTGGSPKES